MTPLQYLHRPPRGRGPLVEDHWFRGGAWNYRRRKRVRWTFWSQSEAVTAGLWFCRWSCWWWRLCLWAWSKETSMRWTRRCRWPGFSPECWTCSRSVPLFLYRLQVKTSKCCCFVQLSWSFYNTTKRLSLENELSFCHLQHLQQFNSIQFYLYSVY